ncbi:MAG: SPOR domain-containing protein [Candidatus Nitrospinota bacterium M3_3B_026]
MTAGGGKGSRPRRAFSSGNRVIVIAGGIAAAALFSFTLGFIASKVYDGAVETTKEGTDAAKTEPYAGFTPKRLDADTIVRGSGEGRALPAPGEFTFNETLKKESVPSADPFKGAKPPAAGQKKQTPQKAEKTVKAVKEKPQSTPQRKAPAPSAPKASPKRDGGGFTIQVGSFASAADAERLRKRLEGRGYNAYTQTAKVKGRTWSRVRVGVFKNASAAKRAAEKLEKNEKLPTLVTAYER